MFTGYRLAKYNAMSIALVLVLYAWAIVIITVNYVISRSQIEFSALLQGPLVLLGAVVVLSGVYCSRLVLAWFGMAVLVASSVLFIVAAHTVLVPLVSMILIRSPACGSYR